MKTLNYHVPGHTLARAVETMGHIAEGLTDVEHDEFLGAIMANPDKNFGVQIKFTREELERLLADPNLAPAVRTDLQSLLVEGEASVMAEDDRRHQLMQALEHVSPAQVVDGLFVSYDWDHLQEIVELIQTKMASEPA
jgi:hypothetical protein